MKERAKIPLVEESFENTYNSVFDQYLKEEDPVIRKRLEERIKNLHEIAKTRKIDEILHFSQSNTVQGILQAIDSHLDIFKSTEDLSQKRDVAQCINVLLDSIMHSENISTIDAYKQSLSTEGNLQLDAALIYASNTINCDFEIDEIELSKSLNHIPSIKTMSLNAYFDTLN